MNDNDTNEQSGSPEDETQQQSSATPSKPMQSQGDNPPPMPGQSAASSPVSDLVAKYKSLPTAVQILIPAILLLGMLTTCCCGGCVLFFGSDKGGEIDEDDVDLKVSAPKLYSDYDSNEVSADSKYKGKTLEVTGSVIDVSKGLFDSVYIALDQGGAMGGHVGMVHCYLTDDSEEEAGKLKKGQRVTIRGKCDGATLGIVSVKNCVIVD